MTSLTRQSNGEETYVSTILKYKNPWNNLMKKKEKNHYSYHISSVFIVFPVSLKTMGIEI
jgi:hypothetical protein